MQSADSVRLLSLNLLLIIQNSACSMEAWMMQTEIASSEIALME